MDHITELPEAAPPRPLVAPTSPRRGAANRIIALHGVSSFCYGLVFPFTGIFLADRPGIGTHGVALYYAVAGVANLAVALVLATGVVRPPRVALGVFGNLLSFAGYLLLPSVGSLSAVGLAAAANGAGQGCFLAAVIPIVNSLVPEADRRQVFARRYQVLNATLALGSLVAGVAISASSRDVIPWLFVVNAIGYLPIAWALLRSRSAATAGEQAQERPAPTAFPVAQLLKASLAVSLFQFGVYLFGYSQFEATAPLVTDKLMHIGLGWISVLIAVNVAVIVTAQKWVTRLLEPHAEVIGLRVAITLWVAGYLMVGMLAFAPPPAGLAGLLLFGVLFAFGECAYSCSYHPWLISKVPDAELMRANALSNSMMGIGLFFGPSIGVGLVGTGSASVVWLTLGTLCGLVGITTARRRRR
ncbi:MFS transporter [Mycobacterium sp. MMS18-G62]